MKKLDSFELMMVCLMVILFALAVALAAKEDQPEEIASQPVVALL